MKSNLIEAVKDSLTSEEVTNGLSEQMKHKIKSECLRLANLLISKNQNYGNSASLKPLFCPNQTVIDGIFCRMGDKVNRIRTLRSGVQDEVGESLADSVRDLAGYCVLALIQMEM